MNRCFWLIFTFVLSNLLSVYCATLRAETPNLWLNQLTTKDGLSQNTIYSIKEDKNGLMWFGTETGIDVYDGYNFTSVLGPDGDFSSYIGKIPLVDSSAEIWLMLEGKGLYSYNIYSNAYTPVALASNNSDFEYISAVVEVNKTQFYFATESAIYAYQRDTNQLHHINLFNDIFQGAFHINTLTFYNDVLFIGSQDGIVAFDLTTQKWRKLPKVEKASFTTQFSERDTAFIYQLYVNTDNTLYLGSYDGVFAIDVSNIKSYINILTPLPPYELIAESLAVWQFFPSDDSLHVASHQGLTKINLKQKSSQFLFDFSQASNKVTDNQIYSLARDKQGIWWLGSGSKGLFTWNPNRMLFNNYNVNNGTALTISNNEITSFSIDKSAEKAFWIGTYNGLNYIDEVTKQVKSYLVSSNSKAIYSKSYIAQIVQPSAHELVVSTGVDSQIFDVKNEKVITHRYSKEIQALFKELPYAIYLDDQKNLWLSIEKGIYKISWQNQTVEKVTQSPSNNFQMSIRGILGVIDNNLLISTTSGLWGLDKSTYELTKLFSKPSHSPNWSYIDSYTIDKNGDMWLVLPGLGLLCVEMDNFTIKHSFDKSNSKINTNLYGIQTDSEGDIWISSHEGLYVLDIESLHLRNITEFDGLPSQEFNGLAYGKLTNGELLYGSMAGATRFDPLAVKEIDHNQQLNVSITGLQLLSRELNSPAVLPQNNTIALAYDDVGIRVNFSTLSYNNNKVLFKYKLIGKQAAESPLTNDNFVAFPFLSSGKHRLEISAQNPITGEMTPATVINFHVSYPPWASPFAFLLYIISFFAIVGYWQYSRFRQRERLLSMHEQVKYRENRLQLALTGSNSEVWDWQQSNHSMFGKRAAHDLGYHQFANAYSFDEHIALIHPDDKARFIENWQTFIEKANRKESFNCTYRLKSHSGEWLWYKDLGKIVTFDKEHKPARVTGSYTNITDAKASEERAVYFGDAFRKTQDWVLIINKDLTRIIANQALQNVFGWQSEEQVFSPKLFGMNENYQRKYRDILASLTSDEHWRGEEHFTLSNGDEYHTIINISVSHHSISAETFYVCVFTDITAQKVAEQDLRYLANYDHLTNLPNRALLIERIDHAMEHSQRNKESIALFFIDLDRFKHVNDSLGHDHGDMLLKEITYRLTNTLRVDDTVARIGGDEFVVLLESYKGTSQLARIAQKIVSAVEKPAELNEHIVSVGASIGIALYPDDAQDADNLLRNADVAMYHAKQLGRNTFQFFTQRMNHEAESRLKIETNIQFAYSNNEFINYYQPIVNTQNDCIQGLELLMRWQSKDGLISPASFISIAEEIGLIISMTEDAIDRGLADLKVWQNIGHDIYLTVNISTQHFNKPSLVPYLASLLDKHKVSPQSLKLEITESALISEPEKVIATMTRLQALGVQLALDDFGTGYSSLSYIKDLPLNIIKIDRSFVSGIGCDPADESIIDVTLTLANNLDMQCIAEGVETVEQLSYLKDKSCHAIQGYLFSKPTSAPNITKLLEKSCLETA